MNGCEVGIVVVLFCVLGLGITNWVDLWRIAKRLDKIEKSLTSTGKEYSGNNDDIHSSKDNKEYTLE